MGIAALLPALLLWRRTGGSLPSMPPALSAMCAVDSRKSEVAIVRRLMRSRLALALVALLAVGWLVRYWKWGQAAVPVAAYWEQDFSERDAPDTIAFINANGVVVQRVRELWFWEPTIFHPGERVLWIAGDRGISEWRDGTGRLVVPAPGITEFSCSRTGRFAYTVPSRSDPSASPQAAHMATAGGEPLRPQDVPEDVCVCADGMPPLVLAEALEADSRNLSWSPDGRRLLFEDKGVVVVTFGSTLQQPSRQRLPESCRAPAAWAGSDTVVWQVAGLRPRKLLKLDLQAEDGKPRVLLERGELRMLAVSPDGTQVACATAQRDVSEGPVMHDLELVDVRSKAVTRRLPSDGHAIDAAVWPLPDAILLCSMEGRREMALTRLDTGSARLVCVSPATGRTRRLRFGATMFVGDG